MRGMRSRAPFLTWALLACLHFGLSQIAGAQNPNPGETTAAKSTVKNARQDGAATEKAQRDARGLLTIEGTVVDESGSPSPNARVRLRTYRERTATSISDSQGRFRFLSLDLPSSDCLALMAENLKDGTKGYLSIGHEGILGLPVPVKVVLKPPRELVVAVNDQQGAPVAGALVEVSAWLYSVAEGRTGPDGTLQLKLPADAEIGTVIAHKSGAGFDYWTNRDDRIAGAEPLPPKLALTLNGARTVRVHASDSLGRPVSGIGIIPWTIMKEGQTNYANLAYFRSQLERTETDSSGIATIDWLPVDLAEGVTFLTTSKDFHLPRPPSLQANLKDNVVDLGMQLLRRTRISGTVYAADGKPAPGVVLRAEGKGDTNFYFRDEARTNVDGEFEFRAHPEQSYLIAVLDENWAAASSTVAELKEDEPVGGLELRLIRGTVVRGVVTDADGRAKGGATVTLIQTAQLAAPAKSPDLVRWADTDREGRYHFRVGPGTYEIWGPNQMPRIPLKIDSEHEVVRDFRAGQ